MNSFELVADPVRRRMLELLTDGERAAGEISSAVTGEFGISQPAVSNQLRVLREAHAVTVRAEGARRVYALAPGALDDVTTWIDRYARLWPQRLDALGTELARGKRTRPQRAGGRVTSRTTSRATSPSSRATSRNAQRDQRRGA